jgi:hypothetical protein
MELKKSNKTVKGGRPAKVVKKDQLLAVMCDPIERKVIEHKARSAGLTTSEYLRGLGLHGQVGSRKALPKEVLQLTALFNHAAANLNQIARKRNRGEELNAVERMELDVLSGRLKEAAQLVKNYLR